MTCKWTEDVRDKNVEGASSDDQPTAAMSSRTGAARPELQTYYWRKKLTPRILMRDGWTCHLCGGAIDPNLRAPHPMSATIDHTRGAETGLDERYLKAAHRSCNEQQGDPVRFIPRRDPAPSGGTRW